MGDFPSRTLVDNEKVKICTEDHPDCRVFSIEFPPNKEFDAIKPDENFLGAYFVSGSTVLVDDEKQVFDTLGWYPADADLTPWTGKKVRAGPEGCKWNCVYATGKTKPVVRPLDEQEVATTKEYSIPLDSGVVLAVSE